jgi:hypothetical protein
MISLKAFKRFTQFITSLPFIALSGCVPYLVGTDDLSLLVKTTPKVVNVSSALSNGFYKAGTVIPITVNFSEQVVVTGSPQLELNVIPQTLLSYSSGSGSSSITFNYTVGATDSAVPTLDYQSTHALILGNGKVQSLFDVDANVTLPVVGGGNSLSGVGFAKLISLDTSAPLAASAVSWVQLSPFNSTAITASWSVSTSNDVIVQRVKFFNNGNCTLPEAATVDVPLITTTTQSFTGTDGNTYSFKIISSDLAGNDGESACSNTMVIDTTAPTIAISSPVTGSWFNIANNSAAFTVSGTCSEVNRTVTIKLDGVSAGTATCTGTLFSGTINSSALSAGAHTLTASISDTATNSTTSSAVNVTKDITAPVASTSVGWSQSSPYNSTSVTASWAKSTSSDLASQQIQFYSSASCGTGTASGPLISLSNTAQTQSFTGVNAGTYTYKITSIDNAGNATASACSSSMVIDTTPPTIAIISPLTGTWINIANDSATFAVSGNCSENGRIVTINSDGNSVGTATCNGTTFSGTINSSTLTQASHSLTASITDTASNTTISSAIAVTRDVVRPTIASGQMTINGGASSTGNNYVQVSLKATDSQSNVTKFCLNHVSGTTPTSSSSCWVSVNAPIPGLTPSQNLNLVNYSYAVSFVPALYTVYAWVMDEAGNISSLSGAGNAGTAGTDKASITVSTTVAPSITDVLVTNTDAPSNPQTAGQLTIATGGTVYIKWKATDEVTLPASPISLFYTTDDLSYTPIAANLVNGQNGTCSVNNATTTADDNDTGCYAWTNGSPSNGYFRIRVTVKDSDNLTTVTTSQAINTSSVFNFVAGNTDPGLNASAKSAVFFPQDDDQIYSDPQSLVVARNGTIYHRDRSRGIIMVSPGDGNKQTLFIPTTGTRNLSGGVVGASTTLQYPVKIALDYQDRLLIWDYDRILRVDTTVVPNTIQTFIGGGASSSDGTVGASFSLGYPGTISSSGRGVWFYPVPNGDLYFTTGTNVSIGAGGKIYSYKASDGKIYGISPSGTGIPGYPTVDVNGCLFTTGGVGFDPSTQLVNQLSILVQDPSPNVTGACDVVGRILVTLHPITGAVITPSMSGPLSDNAYNYRITGRNGSVYSINRWIGQMQKYDSSANTWTSVVGAGSGNGFCNDGSAATTCKIDINDAFVNDQGIVYFMDRGVIRIVDQSITPNQVKTILGQSRSFGDSGNALSARFNMINNVARSNSGEVVAFDSSELRFRSISTSQVITTIAGNGSNAIPVTSSLANAQSVQTSNGWGALVDDFVMNPGTGDLFFSRSTYYISKLARATGTWVDLVGGGVNFYTSADGLLGNQIYASDRELPKVIGFDGSNILTAIGGYTSETTPDPNLQFGYLKKYSITNGMQSHLAANQSSVTPTYTFCTDGTLTANCVVPQTNSIPRYNRATYDSYNTPARWAIMQPETSALRAMQEGTGGLVSTITSFATNASSFAYVHTASNHVAYYCSSTDYKIHKKDITAGTDVVLSWPISTMKCNGRSMVYYENSPTDRRLLFPYLQNNLSGVAEYLNP